MLGNVNQMGYFLPPMEMIVKLKETFLPVGHRYEVALFVLQKQVAEPGMFG